MKPLENMTSTIKTQVLESLSHLKGKRMLRTMRFENLCSTVQLNGWQALLDDNCELGQDHWERAHLRSLWLYRAVVKGDTRGLRNLLKRNYIDVDVFYNVSREELEWQAHTDTIFGPSGKKSFVG